VPHWFAVTLAIALTRGALEFANDLLGYAAMAVTKTLRLYRMRILLGAIAVAACVYLAVGIYEVEVLTVRTAYGGQRMTRAEAEEISANRGWWSQYLLSRMPESEFLRKCHGRQRAARIHCGKTVDETLITAATN
jgi:hypothetical protein